MTGYERATSSLHLKIKLLNTLPIFTKCSSSIFLINVETQSPIHTHINEYLIHLKLIPVIKEIYKKTEILFEKFHNNEYTHEEAEIELEKEKYIPDWSKIRKLEEAIQSRDYIKEEIREAFFKISDAIKEDHDYLIMKIIRQWTVGELCHILAIDSYFDNLIILHNLKFGSI